MPLYRVTYSADRRSITNAAQRKRWMYGAFAKFYIIRVGLKPGMGLRFFGIPPAKAGGNSEGGERKCYKKII